MRVNALRGVAGSSTHALSRTAALLCTRCRRMRAPSAALHAVAAVVAAGDGARGGAARDQDGPATRRRPPPPPSPPQSQSQSQPVRLYLRTADSVVQVPAAPGPAEGAPTAVLRNPGVNDGAWVEADKQLVRAAQREADAAVSAAKPTSASAAHAALLGLSLEELTALAVADGQPAYRGKQLFDALYGVRRARTLDDLALLPKEWRSALAERGVEVGRSSVHAVAAAPDGTAKLLLRLADGRVVETVGIPEEGHAGRVRDGGRPAQLARMAAGTRLTACVSSQVGCPMRCTFCATGKGGFARNLRPHEIVDQVLALEEHFRMRVSNIVFMGMGEPLLNIPSLLAAHAALTAGVGISARAITISTVGVPNAIRRLAEHKLQSTLAVSLHAPTQELREKIIPSAKAYPMDALLEDCSAYFRITGRRVTFEYTLLGGVNDTEEHARALVQTLKRYRLASHVNLIPYNPVEGGGFARPSRNAVKAFEAVVTAEGCGCSVRQTRGLEAAAACGQLRNEYQSRNSEPAPL